MEEQTTVRLTYTRMEQVPGVNEAPTVEAFVVEDVLFQWKGPSLYLRYREPGAEGGGSETRSTLRLEPDSMTMIRHGDVEWNHTFKVGNVQTSSMRVGGMHLPIEIETNELDIRLREDSGTIHLDYLMNIGGELRHVILGIRFGEEATSHERESES